MNVMTVLLTNQKAGYYTCPSSFTKLCTLFTTVVT